MAEQVQPGRGMTPEQFLRETNVSRETLAALVAYANQLQRFQNTINLVSNDSLADLWRRHMLDSAQLYPLLAQRKPEPGRALTVLDIGSGAGFPGLVLAILAAGAGAPLDLHLVESDARKGAFLREAARAAGVSVAIHIGRIERLAPFAVDVITARALAPVARILDLARGFLEFPASAPQCLLLKGRTAREELTAAAKEWKMSAEVIPSKTEPDAAVLRLADIRRD